MTYLKDSQGALWITYPDPCPLDYWVIPHAHLLRDDGTPGIVLMALAELEARAVSAP